MKNPLFVAAGLALSIIAVPALAQDPVKVDAKHYKVEFENDSVRVLRITVGPKEKSVMHSHPNAVAVFLTDGNMKMGSADGKSEAQSVKAGTTRWTPATTHLPENAGDKAFELVLVELKDKAAKK
ncbi:MAG TPA: hypothetical protein VFV17_10565 [Usitatibacteraceae bacterium]|nr:hypothetical protein [Usitatibacteraceae bacterium]